MYANMYGFANSYVLHRDFPPNSSAKPLYVNFYVFNLYHTKILILEFGGSNENCQGAGASENCQRVLDQNDIVTDKW